MQICMFFCTLSERQSKMDSSAQNSQVKHQALDGKNIDVELIIYMTG